MSIARSLLLALFGLTLALAVVAALSVSSLYEARQDYEEALASSYAAEVATANLLAAGVVEETVLRTRGAARTSRDRAAETFRRVGGAAQVAAAEDARSRRLLERMLAAQERARTARGRSRTSAALTEGRQAAIELAGHQAVRRTAARKEASDDSRRAAITMGLAGGLALLGALALVSLLIAGMRRPLDHLVGATRRLAGGELDARVEPQGPAELRELSASFNAMAADLEVARAHIEAGRLRLAATIESLGDALVICDGYGQVVEVNPRARDLVPELVPGRNVAEDPGPLPALGDALESEREVVHGDRTLSITAARMGPGREDGVVYTIRDVTERARLERAKSEFVSTASHELRSPLTSIKGFVELLGGTKLGARQREFVEVILLSTNRLVELVNDLLDVARVEAGQLEIQRRATAVGEAVEEVAALMAPRLAGKHQELELDIAPALPAAWADPARVRQIITNLMTNAHLYTPEAGRIAVRVGAAGDAVTLAISDTGRGMEPEQVERLFERFYRGGDGTGQPGTGLGMSIVKSLVDLHHGTIEVESEPGRGTTVTVRLPRASSVTDLSEPRQAIRDKSVLVVEDESEIARLIVEQLEPYGVDAVVASSIAEARSRLRQRSFDAITLDILLGGSDGFELLRDIRADAVLCRIPVIVVSVLAGQESLAGEWTVGKPIDADELTDAIGSAILAGRARVLVVGRGELRGEVGDLLHRGGIEYVWATSAAEAARLCEEHRFEVALVDAGMRSPQAALAQLDLRGRRLSRSVIVFASGDLSPGMARLQPDPIPVKDATQAVIEALKTTAGQ